jgi:C-terminal processing protease CtpA/Prc
VNWDEIRSSVYQKAGNAQKIEDILPAVKYIFNELKDNHGAIIYKGKAYKKPHKEKSAYRKVLVEQFKSGLPTLRTARFDNVYAYILIPAIYAIDQVTIDKYAQQIQDSLCSLNPLGIKGWIVDLRLNTGGNMYPMIAGIGNIIGDGIVGSFTDANARYSTKWILKNGELFFDDRQLTTIQKKCSINTLPKIAVLISQATSSSGEATAIAFKGRPQTIFIGEKTDGLVTSNNMYQLDSNLILLIAESYEADRNNFIYKDFVTPDIEIIEGDNFYNLRKDKKIIAALKWLKQK